MNHKTMVLTLAAFAWAAGTAGCHAGDDPTTEAPAPAAANSGTEAAAHTAPDQPGASEVTPAAEAGATAETEGAAASAVMTLPLDGSSAETFEAGLARVEAEATPAEHVQLKNALAYLLAYDIGARGKKEVLYSRLSGKTPVQIIDSVRQQRGG